MEKGREKTLQLKAEHSTLLTNEGYWAWKLENAKFRMQMEMPDVKIDWSQMLPY